MTIVPAGPAEQRPGNPHARNVERYFAFARVDGEDDIRESFRIRYQVYCVERRLLRQEDYPDRQETDAYDAQSLHFLASHLDGEPAGTARLVLNGPLGLPLVSHCRLHGGYGFLADPSDPTKHCYAEISRLAVSRTFRRREGDTLYGGPPRDNRPPAFHHVPPVVFPPADVPEMVSGIFRMLYQESKRRGITHWVVAMERSLHVMLKRIGFEFTPIGPEVDYYGPVRPYFAEIAALEHSVSRRKPSTWQYVTMGLESHLVPCFRQEARRAAS
jgi:N-acyl amino acid synthase of PEP-CTERM/exosortase system